MALRAKWQFMDRSVTHKIVYGPQLRFGPYTIVWVTSRFIKGQSDELFDKYCPEQYIILHELAGEYDILRQTIYSSILVQ
jgi:hypothetical protein